MKDVILKENSYYVLKAVATKSRNRYTFYKIGEADKVSRPQDLCNKYTKTTNKLTSTTIMLDYQLLPHNSKKRLNDKTIHKALDKNIFKKVDLNLINGIFEETDGSDEFFEVLDNSLTDDEIVKLIADTVSELAKNSANFTAKLNSINNITLDYKQQKHLVDNNLIEQIEKQYQLDFTQLVGKNILLIGQFLPDWVATFALKNNIVIWHDTKDQVVAYGYEKLNKQITYVNNLQEVIDMEIKFDNIIANPPYGSIGANITDTIRKEIEYTEYVNLLPANDYKRNTNKDLFNYQSDMIAINNGFADAAVTTHCALIHKDKVNNMTLDEFERSQYVDASLDKYFAENSKRKANFTVIYKPSLDIFKTIDIKCSFYINKRDVVNKHLAYTKNCNAYRWNVLEDITHEEVLQNSAPSEQALGNAGDFVLVVFNSAAEKANLSKLIYSDDGFRFIAKIFTAVNKDSYYSPENYLPKVDLTKNWTVDSLLLDYSYSTVEAKEVIDDLANFKGLN